MYCPNCGQQQISDEMRFCSRCGLALSGLAEWLAGGRLPVKPREEPQLPNALSPRRKGIRRAAKLMFFSGVLFPVFLVFSIAAEEGAPMVVPFVLFFISVVLMLYARLFSDKNLPVPAINHAAQTSTLGSASARGSLPPAANIPMPRAGQQHVRTNELAQPPSVTENTTRLLDNE
jgi:zinc-ribbon domain